MNNCGECHGQENTLKNIILPVVEKVGRDPSMLIQILHESQEAIGYLPIEAQRIVADELKIPLSEVYSVVTFYARFTMEPKGKYVISICLGTACYVKGAEDVLDRFERRLKIKSGETTEDGLFTIDVCRCIGACGLAPVLSVNEHVHGNVKPDMVDKIVDEYLKKEEAVS